ncbi:MAG: MFS transporter [Desulfovibrionaceae bacterium]|nr:MFS transporter [Desulfovibrionaceae bacterium]
MGEATEPRTNASAWAILAAMGFGALIAQMFSTVIGPALPTIKDDLDLSLSMQAWTITAYSLAFGTALIAGGRLGDLVGEVRMIVIGYVIFGVGLVLSAMATSGLLMVSGRTVQGIGIGISAPATLSIVVNAFSASRCGFAIGVWGFAHGLGLLVGPIFAGYMLDLLSWRWVFWLAVPLTVAVILVTLAATRNYRSVLSSGRYDILGLVLGGLGITLVTYGLQNASNGWGLPATWGALATGVVLLVVFGVVETRTADPLVDFSLWRERLFAGAFFAESAVGFVYIPMLTFVGSLFFINVLGYSPVMAGWVIVITTGTCMVLEPPAGRLVDRIGPGIPIVASLAMQAAALFWMGAFTAQTTLAELIIPLALMGAGVGIALPACNAAGMRALRPEQAGMGSGLLQMTFNVPAALGVALVTSIMGARSLDQVGTALAGQPFLRQGLEYAQAVKDGNDAAAAAILDALPSESAAMVKQALVSAQSATIASSMTVLGAIALAGAIMALLILGRRR